MFEFEFSLSALSVYTHRQQTLTAVTKGSYFESETLSRWQHCPADGGWEAVAADGQAAPAAGEGGPAPRRDPDVAGTDLHPQPHPPGLDHHGPGHLRRLLRRQRSCQQGRHG